MRIAVCVKHVPEGPSRLDPSTKRLDRSGEGALNHFDANAIEEALRLKGDSDGAVLWAAVAERLGRPVVSQAMELAVDGGSVRVKRQTEFGYDTLEAPLPAVFALGDHVHKPRPPTPKRNLGP